MVTVETLLLPVAKLTVTPPGGAATDRLMGRLSVWPGPSVGSAPRLITLLVTATFTLPEVRPAALPVMEALRAVRPVTVNGAVVAPVANATIGATLTTPDGLVPKVATNADGAGLGIVMRPLIVRPTPTSGPSVVSTIACGITLAVALSFAAFGSLGLDAVRVATVRYGPP